MADRRLPYARTLAVLRILSWPYRYPPLSWWVAFIDWDAAVSMWERHQPYLVYVWSGDEHRYDSRAIAVRLGISIPAELYRAILDNLGSAD